MKRGDIYWADLAPGSGSEQTERRPVVLVSSDGFNQAPGWRSVIVVPLSTSIAQAGRGPTVVEIPSGAAGLATASVAVCHQVTNLDRAKLSKQIGLLPPDAVKDIDDGLKAALDLD